VAWTTKITRKQRFTACGRPSAAHKFKSFDEGVENVQNIEK